MVSRATPNLAVYSASESFARSHADRTARVTAASSSVDSESNACIPSSRTLCMKLYLCLLERVFGRLTFDMSGGTKWAKPALGRPLDGGVRPHEGCAAYG